MAQRHRHDAGDNRRKSLLLEKILEQFDDFGKIINNDNALVPFEQFVLGHGRGGRGKLRFNHVGVRRLIGSTAP